MTCEEFKQLALTPPRRDEDTIFEITMLEIGFVPERRRELYPKFPVRRVRIGFSSTLAGAEKLIFAAISNAAQQDEANKICCFHVKEYPLDTHDEIGYSNYGTSWRLYDQNGNLIDHTWCSSMERDFDTEYGKFRGRPPESIRFKAGDVVEIYDERNSCIRLAIATQSPVDIDWCWRYRERCREELSPGITDNGLELGWTYGLDFGDDQVAVIDGPGYEYHEHIQTLNIMPLRFPLSDKLRLRYERFWKAYQKQVKR